MMMRISKMPVCTRSLHGKGSFFSRMLRGSLVQTIETQRFTQLKNISKQFDPKNLVILPHALQYFRNMHCKIVILRAARLLNFLDHTVWCPTNFLFEV